MFIINEVRYNRVDLWSKRAFGFAIFVRYNRVRYNRVRYNRMFFYNRVRYYRVSQYYNLYLTKNMRGIVSREMLIRVILIWSICHYLLSPSLILAVSILILFIRSSISTIVQITMNKFSRQKQRSTGCQFHQHFTSTFFVLNCFEKHLWCIQFGFVIFWHKKIGTNHACKMSAKLTTGANLTNPFDHCFAKI